MEVVSSQPLIIHLHHEFRSMLLMLISGFLHPQTLAATAALFEVRPAALSTTNSTAVLIGPHRFPSLKSPDFPRRLQHAWNNTGPE